MSIMGIFDIGKSALLASQYALTVTSNNIANINTPGYSKQDVILGITSPVMTSSGSVGRGVSVDGIKRSYDQFLQSQLLGQGQSQGRSAALDDSWAQVERVFNDAQGLGLSSALNDYFNAWSDVATNPTSKPQRVVLLQKAGALTITAQRMESSLIDAVNNSNTGITDSVTRINELATDIAKLNSQVVQEDASASMTASSLRDQRDQKMAMLAELVGFASFEQPDGAVTITVGMRNLVAGSLTNQMSSAVNTSGNQDLFLDGINITSNVQKGKIGGLLAAQTDIQSMALTGLRRLMASITQQVNQLHRTGIGLDSSTGNDFFAPLQLTTTDNSPGAGLTATITNQDLLTLDEYAIGFSGANYTVYNKATNAVVTTAAYTSGSPILFAGISVTITGAVTAADSFTVSPLTSAVSGFNTLITDPQQIAAAGLAAQLPGDNTNALQLAALTTAAQTALSSSTFSDYYNGLVGTVGVMKRSSADGLTFDENLTAALNARRDSVSGVSLDEEAANLIRYQRSYEAGARMISVADQLYQTILNL